jgi:hypothetical protein
MTIKRNDRGPQYFSIKSYFIIKSDRGYMFRQKIHVQIENTCSDKRYMFKQKIHVQTKDTCSNKRYMFRYKIHVQTKDTCSD